MIPRLIIIWKAISIPLEILFFLNGWYYAYNSCWNSSYFSHLVVDVVMPFLYFGNEGIRLFCVALTFPSDMMSSYCLLLQTSKHHLDAILKSVLLFFCGSELLLEVITLAI
ncbi:unnamed protein product [Nyctereutes procyonoides]|uniref:(raccoon dog) hypothetical protein n=1 Tax=Nyctereutes procyonoides TaxID=34880 RepID=A0A811ZVS7_NYCPR|nr:unnamed protein product [Nyctereutes procyonoides]